MAIDGQVCVYRWLFVDPANHEGAIQDLCCGASEQHYLDVCGTKLLRMSVLAYPVDCISFCYLLKTQHRCQYPKGRYNTTPTSSLYKCKCTMAMEMKQQCTYT